MATVAPPRAAAEAPAFEPYAASSVYLALKIGLTVSASIPIAMLAFLELGGVLYRVARR